jgi:uncharacterized NAD(P)/FAD-binding protein YdhS
LAIQLLRFGARVVLVERDANSLAKGLAYGTKRPEHLLNVRASNMSAFPDDAGHFQRWMGFNSEDQANRFAPRLAYGHYLRELLMDALAAAPDRIRIVASEVVAADFTNGRAQAVLANGERIAARTVVLALGNPSPSLPAAVNELPPATIIADPWQGALEPLAATDCDILLLGTGLTAIDVALALDAAGHRGTITALSRRGLRPRVHDEKAARVEGVGRPDVRKSWLIRHIRNRAAQVGWRVAVDELRPHIQDLWRAHDEGAQRSFLRHLRPFWDAHRHRLAPAVAGKVQALEAEGRLKFIAGRILRAEGSGAGALVHWKPRGVDRTDVAQFDYVINCTGPEGSISRIANPLLRDLLDKGRVRSDVHELGLDVDHLGRVIDSSGGRTDELFAVGPLTKGEAWEIVAVPDIRRQVWELARYLTNRHWVSVGL